MNSRRRNLPLYIWYEEGEEGDEQDGKKDGTQEITRVICGEKHFIPPCSQRGLARLARKWLYMRATYGNVISPPSQAQQQNFHKIVALAKHYNPYPAEIAMNELYDKTISRRNPLINSHEFYDSLEWRSLCMSGWSGSF